MDRQLQVCHEKKSGEGEREKVEEREERERERKGLFGISTHIASPAQHID